MSDRSKIQSLFNTPGFVSFSWNNQRAEASVVRISKEGNKEVIIASGGTENESIDSLAKKIAELNG